MSSFITSRFLLALLLLTFYSNIVSADSNLSFSFKKFGKDSNFESQLALYGDAKVVVVSNSNTSYVEMSGSRAFSSGRFICKKPINLIQGNSRNLVSFQSYFVFSLSKDINGDGLAFVMFPAGFDFNSFGNGSSMGMFGEKKSKIVAIEFDTFKDDKFGDLNGNHVGVDVGSLVSVKASNASSIDLVLDSGKKLQTWIDYEASSKRFEVRLSKFGDNRPVSPLLTFPFDLSKMWRWENVIVGLSSSSGNSTQKSNVYAWSFRSRIVPHSMHSDPMNPENYTAKGDEIGVPKKSDCGFKIASALIFGAGLGALGAFLVLFVWTIFGNRRPIAPEEFPAEAKKCEYEKFDVVVEKTVEDGKM